MPCKCQVVGSISTRGGFYPKQMRFVLGKPSFLLSCLPSLCIQDGGTFAVTVPLSNIKLKYLKSNLNEKQLGFRV
jgi:hypothetical protein